MSLQICNRYDVEVVRDSGFDRLIMGGRMALNRAREWKVPDLLLEDKVFSETEAKILGYLEEKGSWGLDETENPSIVTAFETLCEAFDYIIQSAAEDISFEYNKKLNRLEKLAKVTSLKSYPIRCYFEPTNRCNLRCEMCGQSFFKGERTTIPREAVELVAPHFKWFEEISIFGYGESLLVDYLDHVLDHIPDRAVSKLVTNGILLDGAKSRMLVDHGLKLLLVSVDAARPGTYQQVRGADKLETVKQNIRELVQYKNACNREYPGVSMSFVAMRRNIEQLPDFIRMADSLGVRSVIVDYLIVFSEKMREQSLYYYQDLADEYIDRAARVAEELGVCFHPPTKFSDFCECSAGPPTCYEPWEFVLFRSDGYIQPCCTNSDKIASWLDTDFRNYWNSKELQEMRLMKGTPLESEWCRNCLHACHRDIRKESSHIHIMSESMIQD
jgi:MoaA/NifB/PqqE/SkfB family radical SAM enzyme